MGERQRGEPGVDAVGHVVAVDLVVVRVRDVHHITVGPDAARAVVARAPERREVLVANPHQLRALEAVREELPLLTVRDPHADTIGPDAVRIAIGGAEVVRGSDLSGVEVVHVDAVIDPVEHPHRLVVGPDASRADVAASQFDLALWKACTACEVVGEESVLAAVGDPHHAAVRPQASRGAVGIVERDVTVLGAFAGGKVVREDAVGSTVAVLRDPQRLTVRPQPGSPVVRLGERIDVALDVPAEAGLGTRRCTRCRRDGEHGSARDVGVHGIDAGRAVGVPRWEHVELILVEGRYPLRLVPKEEDSRARLAGDDPEGLMDRAPPVLQVTLPTTGFKGVARRSVESPDAMKGAGLRAVQVDVQVVLGIPRDGTAEAEPAPLSHVHRGSSRIRIHPCKRVRFRRRAVLVVGGQIPREEEGQPSGCQCDLVPGVQRIGPGDADVQRVVVRPESPGDVHARLEQPDRQHLLALVHGYRDVRAGVLAVAVARPRLMPRQVGTERELRIAGRVEVTQGHLGCEGDRVRQVVTGRQLDGDGGRRLRMSVQRPLGHHDDQCREQRQSTKADGGRRSLHRCSPEPSRARARHHAT